MRLGLLCVLLGVMTSTTTPAQVQRFELVIAGRCVEAIERGHNFECHGQDKDHMTCNGLLLTYKSSCAQIRVMREVD